MVTFDKLSTNRNIDLHTHTIHSDGYLTPEELVQKAKEANLAAIAVADHENTDGIDPAIKVGKKLGIEIVPAVEITSHPDPETEHHILGYFIDHKNTKLQKVLSEIRESREERAKKVIKNLNDLGYYINFGDVKATAKGTIVAPHIAFSIIQDRESHAKLKKEFGHIPDTGEFIRKYLVPGAQAYESRKTLTPKESIDLIHHSGGIAVLAHPCWTAVTKKNEKLVFDDRKLRDVVDLGVEGIEALAHRENEKDTKICVEHFEKLAKKYKLVVTGGSDFHGFGSAGKDIGFRNFYLKVPYSILEELKKRAR